MDKKLILLLIWLFAAGAVVTAATPFWQLEKPFTGGGADERIAIAVSGDFPIRQGALTARFCLNQDMDSGEVAATIFDYLSTPDFYDRLLLRVLPNPVGGYFLEFTACESDQGRYAGYHLRQPISLRPGEWHEAEISWENLNSGDGNAVLKLYFDGVLLEERSGLALHINNTADHFNIGAAHPPLPGGIAGVLSLDTLALWPAALTPADFNPLREVPPEPLPSSALMSVAPTPDSIQIDGVLAEAEWQSAASAGPFVLRRDGKFAPYPTDLRIMYSNQKLYFGWQANTDAAPLIQSRSHDAPLWYDDSMEILISPDGKNVIHIIGNAQGVIYDEWSEDGGKHYDSTWNGEIDYQATHTGNSWSGELAIDLAANQLPAIQSGDTWYFNAVRNGFTPQAESSWNLSPAGDIRLLERLGQIRFTDAMRHVRITPPATFFPGTATLELELLQSAGADTGPAIDVAFGVATGERRWRSAQRFQANRNGVREFAVTIPESGDYDGVWEVTGADGVLLGQRPFAFHVAPLLELHVEAGAPLETLRATVDVSRLHIPFHAGVLRLMDLQRQILREIPLEGVRESYELTLEALDEGDYIVAVLLTDADGITVAEREQRFHRYVRPRTIAPEAGRRTAWQGWSPVSRQGADIGCWNRTYRLNDTIFPEQMISAGEDLLSGTPEFQYTVNGIPKSLRAATLWSAAASPERVELTLEGSNEDIRISGTVAVEYDGAVIYELALEPERADIRDFALVIPLNPASAQLILEGTEYTYRAEKNIIGSQVGWRRQMPFQFKFGIGNGDRALYWFIESDRGWLPYDRDDTVEITRETDSVQVKLQVVAGEHSLTAGRWKCGFIATPLKPVDFALDDLRVVHAWPGGQYFSSDPADYSRFDIRQAYEYGARVIVLHEFWPLYYGGCEPVNAEDLKRFVREAHDLGMRVVLYRSHLAHPAEPDQAYFNRSWLAYPLVAYVSSDSRPHSDGVTRCPSGRDFVDYSIGSNEKLLLDYDIDGFYYDIAANPCANGMHDCGYDAGRGGAAAPPAGPVTIGMDTQSEAPNPYAGRRVTYPLLKEREFWQRMYNMVHEHRGERGLVIAHVSWVTDAMYCGFSDSVCHSEFSACYWDGEKLPTLEQYRVFFSKQFWGLPGSYLCYQPAQRALLGMALLHRESYWMKTFGNYSFFQEDNYGMCRKVWTILADFGVDEAQWRPYYAPAPELTVTPGASVSMSSWRKGDRILAVVANLSDTEAVTASLSAPGFRQATDRLRGGVLPRSAPDGPWRLELGAQDFTIIEVQD